MRSLHATSFQRSGGASAPSPLPPPRAGIHETRSFLHREMPAPGRRIRLMLFITNFHIGGTEKQFVLVGQRLDRRLFDVRVGCLHRVGAYVRPIEASGLSVQEFPVRSLRQPGTLWHLLSLVRALRHHRIDLVHAYGLYANIFAVPAARLARVPAVVASIRDMGDIWTPSQRRVQRLVCRMADRVTVNARVVARHLAAEGYDPGRLTVIPNGIDTAPFDGIQRDGRIRDELGIPRDVPLVGVVSRLNPDKGIDHFLRAAAMVTRHLGDVRFLVLGDGPSRADLERLARELGLAGRVVFAGFRLDVPQALAELSVSVLPTLSEAMSNTLMESMAAGVPVVATRVGGNPEAIEEDVTGLLVPPAHPHRLALAILRILRDPELAAAFGRAGRRRVERHFSPELTVMRTETLYRDLIAGAAGLPLAGEAA